MYIANPRVCPTFNLGHDGNKTKTVIAKTIPNEKLTEEERLTYQQNDLGCVYTHYDPEQGINVPTENVVPPRNKVIKPRSSKHNKKEELNNNGTSS